ncbi:MAG TPA: universal stress protein [Thermodesulfovibrionales bacterium]|nr:universal stress protein [Thermodesulfovibrionales bacterium]
MKGYKKIVIAVDGSKDVLTQGLRLAHDEKCWVTVVKVVPPQDGDLNLVGIRNIGDVLDNGARRETNEIMNIAKTESSLVKTRIEEGDIPEKIVEVAEDEKCDLIIMGTNKTNWFRKLFGKNIVEKVINQAPCPVLVVGA